MALPIAAIICIVLACWVVVVLIIFALYQLLKTRGSCGCDCAPCGKEGGGGCSECCISVAESCNCCNPSVNGCLDSVCPGKKKISCVDIILCQCCANEGEESCCIKMFCCCCCCCDSDCDCCQDECCTCCADCDTLVCCCLEIRCRSNSEKTDAQAVKYETKSQQVSSNPSVTSSSDNSTGSTQKHSTGSKSTDRLTKNIKPPPKRSSSKKGVGKLALDSITSGKGVEKSEPDSLNTARSVNTARSTAQSINTARSISQVKVTTDTGSKKRTPRSKKPSSTSVNENSDIVLRETSSLSSSETRDSKGMSRALPPPPRPQQPPKFDSVKAQGKPDTGSTQSMAGAKPTPRKRKESGASALVEVPVKQRNIPLHTCTSPRPLSDYDISLAAYQQYATGEGYEGYVNNQMSSSDMQIYSNEAVTHVHNGYGASGFFGAAGDVMSGQSLESLVPSGRSIQRSDSARARPLPHPLPAAR